jgi:hypothetical protein
MRIFDSSAECLSVKAGPGRVAKCPPASRLVYKHTTHPKTLPECPRYLCNPFRLIGCRAFLCFPILSLHLSAKLSGRNVVAASSGDESYWKCLYYVHSTCACTPADCSCASSVAVGLALSAEFACHIPEEVRVIIIVTIIRPQGQLYFSLALQASG